MDGGAVVLKVCRKMTFQVSITVIVVFLVFCAALTMLASFLVVILFLRELGTRVAGRVGTWLCVLWR